MDVTFIDGLSTQPWQNINLQGSVEQDYRGRVSKPNRMTDSESGNALWEEVRLPSDTDSHLQPEVDINRVV